jgi:O-Antigen ligase
MTVALPYPGAVPGSRWTSAVAGFLAYVGLFLAGFFIGQPAFNIAGFALMLLILTVGNSRLFLALEWNAATFLAFLSMFAAVLSYALNFPAGSGVYLVKHLMLLYLYVILSTYGLSPMHLNPTGRWLVLGVYLLLAASFLIGGTIHSGTASRFTGVFVNPNNLALMGLSLLFFLSPGKPAWNITQILLVLVVLLFTSTTGALLGVVAALMYKYKGRLSPRMVFGAFLILLAIAIALSLPSVRGSQLFQKFEGQFRLIYENIGRLKPGRSIDYGSLREAYGEESLSGYWRLAHWTKAASMFLSAQFPVWFFGFGIGSSKELLGKLPHNEYLRFVFEQGILGGGIAFLFFRECFRRVEPEMKYNFVAVFVFAITENIIDNMVFMSIFLMALVSFRSVAFRRFREKEA